MKNDSFIIQGLGGAKTLKGSININGAKNAALKAMAAAVLFDGPVELTNIPDTEDVHTMTAILEKLGAKVQSQGIGMGNRALIINPRNINLTVIDPTLASAMRASVVLTGPLLARFGKVSFPAPGGCVIGARPIDQFIRGYENMGANVVETDCIFNIEMNSSPLGGRGSSRFPFTGFEGGSYSPQKGGTNIVINFEKKTVGGTETLMMASVLCDGTVTLNNCAQEPEIVNVAEWLNECGADVRGVGTDTITINGTNGKLLSPQKPYIAIPDRIEAGSYLILGALCASDLKLNGCRPDHLKVLIDLLVESGVPITFDKSSISIKGNTKPNSTFTSFDVSTREYPGFPTDLQAQIVTYLTQVSGTSRVAENIFEGRFKYVSDLNDMGANIVVKGVNEVAVSGPTILNALPRGNNLFAHDLRAGFAMVMAALVAEGASTVENVYFIDRGYEKLEERLTALGAKISRVKA